MIQEILITGPDQALSESTEKAVCCHHWMIQAAEGPVSMGTCRFCCETKEFKNSIEDWSLDKEANERIPVEATEG